MFPTTTQPASSSILTPSPGQARPPGHPTAAATASRARPFPRSGNLPERGFWIPFFSPATSILNAGVNHEASGLQTGNFTTLQTPPRKLQFPPFDPGAKSRFLRLRLLSPFLPKSLHMISHLVDSTVFQHCPGIQFPTFQPRRGIPLSAFTASNRRF